MKVAPEAAEMAELTDPRHEEVGRASSPIPRSLRSCKKPGTRVSRRQPSSAASTTLSRAARPARTVEELRELQELTGDENGAQRVAWTETWERAREWLRAKVDFARVRGGRGRERVVHPPRRLRARAPDRRPHRLRAERRLARRLPERDRRRRGAAAAERGGHAAADGAPRQLGGRGGRALRAVAVRLERGRWLDGRPGRAAQPRRRGRNPRSRTPSASTGSTSTARPTRGAQLENAAAYLELHIEQGPVLESLDLPLGVVLGTFGVERHLITWTGQAAHAGSTPMDRRRDALAGAAKLALDIRRIAAETGDGAVCTSGGVVCKPGIVTSVVETAEQLLDQRHLDAGKLAGDARRGEGSVRAVRRRRRTSRSRGRRSGRSSRSCSTRRWSGSPRRRSRRSRGRPTGCRAGRCTTPPRSPARGSRR